MKGMSLIVKTITKLITGFIFLYGCYIVLHGHLTPGGGFAGGVIIASSFILWVLAFGRPESWERTAHHWTQVLESAGGLGFLILGLAGVLAGSWFFLNLLAKGTPLRLGSAGIILPCNIAIGIKVSAGLLAIFLALAAVHYLFKD
jgi:multicomponent Na+:H+ antiporter subunit B